MSVPTWPDELFEELVAGGVRQVAYVPDAGHKRLIERSLAAPGIEAVSLTTEEEGVAMLAGAFLGGQRGVLLLQSSGVGNCINMLSLPAECRIPMLMIITMRGEWGEFNPWQITMGQGTQASLEAVGVLVNRVESAADVAPTVRASLALAYNTGRVVAVLLSQKVIGAKMFKKGDTK